MTTQQQRQLRREGWALCLEGVALVGLAGLLTLIFQWSFESRAGAVTFGVACAFALYLLIAGLVKVVKGWDRNAAISQEAGDDQR